MLGFNRQFYFRLLLVFLGSLFLTFGYNYLNFQGNNHNIVNAQTSNVIELVDQGVSNYHNGNFQGAIADWENALKLTSEPNDRAKILEYLARIYQEIGQNSYAINNWKDAISTLEQLNNLPEKARLLIELAQAYTIIGQPQQAITILCNQKKDEINDENITQNTDQMLKNCQVESVLYFVQQENICQDQGCQNKIENLKILALGSLGEAYRLTGKYELGIKILTNSLEIATNINDINKQYVILNSRGNTYLSLAKYDERRALSAENLAQINQNTVTKLKQSFQNNYLSALDDFQESFKIAKQLNNSTYQMQSLLSLIPIYYRSKAQDNPLNLTHSQIAINLILTTEEALKEAQKIFNYLPNNSQKVDLALKLSNLLQPVNSVEEIEGIFAPKRCLLPQFSLESEILVKEAKTIAQNLNYNFNNNNDYDHRGASFSLGQLAHLYECRENYAQALEYTQEAQLEAQQNLIAKDSLYLWEWQEGRILKATNQENLAINAYQRAINTLEGIGEGEGGIRSDILIANKDIQFDFRDNIKPLYQDFIELKLDQVQLLKNHLAHHNNKQIFTEDNQDLQDNLKSIFNNIDSLQLAELQNYFKNECKLIIFSQEKIDSLVNENTIIFSSIILDKKTAIIVTLPNGKKDFTFIPLDQKTLRTKINEFRQGLERYRDEIYDDLTLAQEFYQYIIQPFESYLKPEDTLVFIQDAILRSIPMATLHNGQQFLIENYNIATTPSLKVTIPTVQNSQTQKALILGLSEPSKIDNYSINALPEVVTEAKNIQTIFTDSDQFLNEEFNFNLPILEDKTLEDQIKNTNYSIIHIATHGQFSTVREDSFLITGEKTEDGNNEKLKMSELERIIREKKEPQLIEILALSACQTAVGDDRAALGLAGVALQAGVRSAIASLWSVSSESTQILVTEFYKNWHEQKMSKTQALRTAQIHLLQQNKYQHPAYWSPFILIGNWL